jgi:hypothetical protein
VNAFFYITIELRPESGVSWSGKRLKVFSPRSDSLIKDSIAECQWGLKPIAVACDYDGMNTFFSTRWRIGRFIPCEWNAPDSHQACYLRPHRAGPVGGTVAKVFFSQARVTRWEGTIARTEASR